MLFIRQSLKRQRSDMDFYCGGLELERTSDDMIVFNNNNNSNNNNNNSICGLNNCLGSSHFYHDVNDNFSLLLFSVGVVAS